ncbi:unnamed protein product [Paramecium primaurelia]|uniref:Uncharacterized protein n=1 Tax=Paramecium primaurelia TaxID=5886 RepID=A0A8S1MIW0_PARPR|nr:unnamed protein product [Paramecium primaurelia]
MQLHNVSECVMLLLQETDQLNLMLIHWDITNYAIKNRVLILYLQIVQQYYSEYRGFYEHWEWATLQEQLIF